MKENLIKTPIYKRKVFIILLLLFSMLPGIIVSCVLFFNALSNDIKNQNLRNSVTSVDLSQVAIGSYTDYPQESRHFSDPDSETYEELTIQGVPVLNFESAVQILGDDYVTIEYSRSFHDYHVFIDRENDLELRFCYYRTLPIDRVRLMRIDERSTTEYFFNRSRVYDDNFAFPHHGERINMIYTQTIFDTIKYTFEDNEFLFAASDYIVFLFYSVSWFFPFIWAVYRTICKRNLRCIGWWIGTGVWYFFWYVFCFLTMAVRQ